MAEVSPNDISDYGKYLLSQGQKPEDVQAYTDYLAGHHQVDAPKMGAMDAAKIKASEGATLGLRPVVAGLGAAAGDTYGQLTGSQPYDFGQTMNAFLEGRHGAIDQQKKASADHPYISGGANVVGSLLTAPLLPLSAGLGGAVKLGAGFGAANAVGSAESVGEAAQDVAGGTLGGAGGYGIAKTGGRVVGNALEGFAENKAFKAAGAMLKDFRNAFNREPDKINDLGRTMLDNGLVKAGDSVGSIAQKSEQLRRQTGQQIGDVYDKVLGTLTDPASNVAPEVAMQIQAAGFHPEQQAEEMKAMVSAALKGKPGSTQAIAKAHQVIDELAMNGNNITPDHALELKGGIDSMVNWSKKAADLPLDQDALKLVRNYIQERLNTQVQGLDQVLGNSQSKELARLNQLYGNVSTIANVAKDRVLRESANQSFGLGDKMAGGIGSILGLGAEAMGAGGGHGGLVPLAAAGAGVVGNKLARTYGNAAVASGADSLGRLVSNPAAYAPGIGNLINSGTDYLGGAPEQQQNSVPIRMSRTIKARSPAGK